MELTKNFTIEEFCHSDMAQERGIINQINSQDLLRDAQALCRYILQPLRDELGLPIHISSGFRCEELNRLVGGVPTSQHAKAQAADIQVKGMRPIGVARAIINLALPYDQLIVYPTFVHVSFTRYAKNRQQLLYNRRYVGEKI